MNIEEFSGQFGLNLSAGKYPVQSWAPPFSGDMNLVIKKDGTWWHDGVKFTRDSLVLLFSSILKREGDEYFLVSPIEKWRIQVEDTPLHIISVSGVEGGVVLMTSERELICLDKERTLSFSELDGVSVPVVNVRDGLDARFSRNAYYALVRMGEEVGRGVAVDSFGQSYMLMA